MVKNNPQVIFFCYSLVSFIQTFNDSQDLVSGKQSQSSSENRNNCIKNKYEERENITVLLSDTLSIQRERDLLSIG